jgi:hypothetical protein
LKIRVNTLTPQEAEEMARTYEPGTASNGCVERYGLRWRSDALRTWEVMQRGLGRKPEVSIRIDELDLSLVYVEPLQGERAIFRATSTQPTYTKNLSLFEHNRLKAALQAKDTQERLVRMSDKQAFNLRIEYHAALGRADDPIAYRRLVGLRDELAALRDIASSPEETTHLSLPDPAPSPPAKQGRHKPKRPAALPPAKQRQKGSNERTATSTSVGMAPAESLALSHSAKNAVSVPVPDESDDAPFPEMSIKRIPL